jgi:hypothetical protein
MSGMRTRSTLLQARALFAVILMNFAAQIPYFFHNHYQSQPLSISARSFLIMGSVFGFFLTASFLLFTRQKAGYALMLAFLSAEFLFYLWGVIGSMIHGYGIFFQMGNPDVLLRSVFAIGYLNFAASGYFIFLLMRYRHYFQPA